MVKFKGAGSSLKAPDTSGVQRAHEGLMGSMQANTQQANQAGAMAQQAVGNVQEQEALQLRKDQLAAEMAKGGLEFQGTGSNRKVVQTEGAAQMAEREMQTKEAKVKLEQQRAAAYEMSQQVALIKAGYTEDGELTEEGRSALKNLAREYKKQQKLFERINRGDQEAFKEAQTAVPDIPGAVVPGGPALNAEEAGGPPMDPKRVVQGVRAKLDHEQIKFVVNTKGEMPEDVMDDSPAWQQFHTWKADIASMMRSGLMMTPPFRNLKERNRFLNEAAARMVLKGRAAPGSMAQEPMLQGMVPAQAPAGGQPTDGSTEPRAPQSRFGDELVEGFGNPAAGPTPGPGGWGQQH